MFLKKSGFLLQVEWRLTISHKIDKNSDNVMHYYDKMFHNYYYCYNYLEKKAIEKVYLVTEHYCISIKKASLSQFPPKSG